jgi:hypothetical protein
MERGIIVRVSWPRKLMGAVLLWLVSQLGKVGTVRAGEDADAVSFIVELVKIMSVRPRCDCPLFPNRNIRSHDPGLMKLNGQSSLTVGWRRAAIFGKTTAIHWYVWRQLQG